jgi:hypothetical protein
VDTKISIGIVSIATNKYMEYWKDLVLSADKLLFPDADVTFHVFTENPQEAERLQSQLIFKKIVAHKIEPYTWPEATLLRYKVIKEHANLLKHDYLMHLDADMLVNGLVETNILVSPSPTNMTLVLHPGFWRPTGVNRVNFYFLNPSFVIRDLRMLVNIGALGSWENDANSLAYVGRKWRKKYFCGAVWLGKRENFIDMAEELAFNTEEDLKKGIIATWHDESHLNNWASKNGFQALSPTYCFYPPYVNLMGLPNKMEAVDKQKESKG